MTRSTSPTCASIGRLRCTMPIPPSRASAIAMRASVTVSIAADTIGDSSTIVRVRRDAVETSFGRTDDSAGTSRTSSKVSPSFANFSGSVLPKVSKASFPSSIREGYRRSRTTPRRARARTRRRPPAGGLPAAGRTCRLRPRGSTRRRSRRQPGALPRSFGRRDARPGRRRAARRPAPTVETGSSRGATARNRRNSFSSCRSATQPPSVVISTLRAPISAIRSSASRKSSSSWNSWPTSASASAWFGETRNGSASTPDRSGSPSVSSTTGT